MKSKVIVTAAAILAVVAAMSIYMWSRSGPRPSDFAYVAMPRIAHLDDQRMVVVEAVGDPNVVAGGAFKMLFATYYKLPGVSRSQKPPAPRARWTRPLEIPRSEWKGEYALPLPSSIDALPADIVTKEVHVTIRTWQYGDVAEVLHVGPYSREVPNIDRLHAFITSAGYEVIGDHEEEYVRGPGMIFAGDPEKYLTIIRLRVAPMEPGIE